LFKGLFVCSWISVTLYFLAFSSPVVWYCLPFYGFVCFHSLCAELLVESFVVVAWWSYIVLVSAYHGRLLLLYLFWRIVLLGRVSYGCRYFHSVPGISYSMPFLLLRFLLRNLVILVSLPLYIIHFFFLTASNMISLFSVLVVVMIIYF
jgi:hypothetical protein